MINCKKCVHFPVCRDFYNEIPTDAGKLEFLTSDCRHFADVSKMLQLPCKVGDKIYRIEPFFYHIFDEDCSCNACNDFYDGGEGGLEDAPDCKKKEPCKAVYEYEADLRMIVDIIQPNNFTKIIEFGKTAFLTREEAEKALKELRK